MLGFRSGWHAEAAALVPNAEVAIEPTLVTELIRPGHDVLACGPEPMLQAVRRRCPVAAGLGGTDGVRLRRLRLRSDGANGALCGGASMACGSGPCCPGCAVELDGGRPWDAASDAVERARPNGRR